MAGGGEEREGTGEGTRGKMAACDWGIGAIVWLLLVGSAALALSFVTRHDLTSDQEKVGLITEIGSLLKHVSPQLGWQGPHPNIVAGVLEIGLPVKVAPIRGGDQWSASGVGGRQ